MDKQLYYDDLPWKDGLDSQAIRLYLKERQRRTGIKSLSWMTTPQGCRPYMMFLCIRIGAGTASARDSWNRGKCFSS